MHYALNPSLSFGARGLMAYLVHAGTEGHTLAVADTEENTNYIIELLENGYLKANGKAFDVYEYPEQ